MQIWIIISIIAMLANSGKVLIVKLACKNVDARLLVLSSRLLAGLTLTPILLITSKAFPASPKFYTVTFTTAILTAIASITFTQAVKKGRLSIVIPMQASVPTFALLALFLIYRETLKPITTILLVLSMAAVAYTLYENNRSAKKSHISHPLKYSIYSIIAAFIFGICTILDRVAISQIANGALAYSAVWNLFSTVIIAAECKRKNVLSINSIKPHIIPVFLYAAANMFAFIGQQTAIQLSLVIPGAVVNVKTIIMFYMPTVTILGWLFLKEKTTPRTLLAGLAGITAAILLIHSMSR